MVTAAAMEEIYANIDVEKPANSTSPNNQTGPRSSERRFPGCVALCLGLLCVFLLIGLICLGVIYHKTVLDSSTQLSKLEANLTERDLLKANLTMMTSELDRLQRWSRQMTTCPAGWKNFSSTCYFFSTKKNSWDNSLTDCKDKGADLVIIESKEEQDFITRNIKESSWIGLSDKDNEGTWKWTDGTGLNLTYWYPDQPDGGGGSPEWGDEDCAHIATYGESDGNWNDLRCDSSQQWICEA